MVMHLNPSKISSMVPATTDGSFLLFAKKEKKKKCPEMQLLIFKGILNLKNNYTKDVKIK